MPQSLAAFVGAALTALLCLEAALNNINFLQRAEELSQIVRIIVSAGHRGEMIGVRGGTVEISNLLAILKK